MWLYTYRHVAALEYYYYYYYYYYSKVSSDYVYVTYCFTACQSFLRITLNSKQKFVKQISLFKKRFITDASVSTFLPTTNVSDEFHYT